MEEWEKKTCLRFIKQTNERDYVIFRSDTNSCSSHLGRKGGIQYIRLSEPGCLSHGTILHEIGHAVGFWHEQSRPDRDNYVKINSNNIKLGKNHNFRKRNSFETDYQGTVYDYDSVLHYHKKSFSRNGRDTITVVNFTEYQRQGSPYIGQRRQLSVNDVIQANRLYNCKGSGLHGDLTVHVGYAENIIGDNISVLVTTKDDSNNRVDSNIVNNFTSNGSVIFEQTLSYGERNWQNVEISIWTGNQQATPKQTFSIEYGRNYHKHCNDVACNTHLHFYTDLVADENNCVPNPCRNEEVCTDLLSNYTCTCRTEYTGDKCQYRKSSLAISINSSEINECFNKSDLFMEAVAADVDGYKEIQTNRYISNGSNQTDSLRFIGWRAWTIVKIYVYGTNLLDDAIGNQLIGTHHHTGIMNWDYNTSYPFSLCSKNCSSCVNYEIYKYEQ